MSNDPLFTSITDPSARKEALCRNAELTVEQIRQAAANGATAMDMIKSIT